MSEHEPSKPQDQWTVEDYLGNLRIDFDSDNRILHLSAHQTTVLASPEQIDLQGQALERTLKRYGPEPLYVIIDLPRFVIEPSLAPVYSSKMVAVVQGYVYPKGVARYGLNMTRVTVKMAHVSHPNQAANLFSTRAEAEEYIRGLIKQQRPVQSSQSASTLPSAGR